MFSAIPRLAKLVREQLTNVNVIEVEHKGMATVFNCTEELSLHNDKEKGHKYVST